MKAGKESGASGARTGKFSFAAVTSHSISRGRPMRWDRRNASGFGIEVEEQKREMVVNGEAEREAIFDQFQKAARIEYSRV